MKLYDKEATAKTIASKKSKGSKVFEAQPQDGKWVVIQTAGPGMPVIEAGLAMDPNEAPAFEEPAPDTFKPDEAMPDQSSEGTSLAEPNGEAVAASTPLSALVSTVLPGAYVSGDYLYTKEIAGKERWFQTSDFTSMQPVDGGIQVVLPRKALTKRKIIGHLTVTDVEQAAA